MNNILPDEIVPNIDPPDQYKFTFSGAAHKWLPLSIKSYVPSAGSPTKQAFRSVCEHIMDTHTGKFMPTDLRANIAYKTPAGIKNIYNPKLGITLSSGSPLYVNANGYWELTKPAPNGVQWSLIFRPGKEIIWNETTHEFHQEPQNMCEQFTIQLVKTTSYGKSANERTIQQWHCDEDTCPKLVNANTGFTPNEVSAFQAFCQMFVKNNLIPTKLPLQKK